MQKNKDLKIENKNIGTVLVDELKVVVPKELLPQTHEKKNPKDKKAKEHKPKEDKEEAKKDP